MVHTTPDGHQLQSAARLDIGRLRQWQEDALVDAPRAGLFAVLDGMGGASTGYMASEPVRDLLLEIAEQLEDGERDATGPPHARRLWCEFPAQAQARIRDRLASSSANGTGTELAMLSLAEGDVYLSHIGMCRVYLWRAGQLTRLTRDHSLPNNLLRRGLEPAQFEGFRYDRVVTRLLGAHPTFHAHLHHHCLPAHPGDVYLLCTDGLHRMLEDDAIASLLREHGADLEVCADALLTGALEAGGEDNLALVLARLGEGPGPWARAPRPERALWGELRAALHAPSADSWQRVVAALEAWPEGPGLREALAYGEQMLKGWPEALERAAPFRWLLALLRGVDEPRLRLVDTLRTPPGHQLEGGAVEHLVQSEHLDLLRHLSLRDGGLTDEHVLLLTSWPGTAPLRSLDLVRNDLGSRAAGALADPQGRLQGLRALDLSGNWLADHSARELTSLRLRHLEVLRLRGNAISDEGARTMARAPHFAQLLELDLEGNRITEEGARALATSEHLREPIRARWRRWLTEHTQ